MIIVTGTVKVRAERLENALEVSLEHVRRSRTEPGCLLHSVHRDVEDPLTLVFLEHWEDNEALAAHFAVPESLASNRLSVSGRKSARRDHNPR